MKFKTLEVVDRILKDSNLKFESGKIEMQNENGQLYCYEENYNRELNITSLSKYIPKFDKQFLELEWELIQKSVDFMTAIKAFGEGKTIKCKSSDLYRESVYSKDMNDDYMRDQEEMPITVNEILKGEWYIEN